MKLSKKIYELGPHKGTYQELADILKIKKGAMKNRFYKFVAGKISLEKALLVGKQKTGDGNYGNKEWDFLSGKI